MKPLFTVHGGEYLVGSYIEQHYKQCERVGTFPGYWNRLAGYRP